MSQEGNTTAAGKLDFTNITEDDIKAFLQEKVKNHMCPCCNSTAWSIISSPGMNFGLVAFATSGAFNIPPPYIPIVGVACSTCGYVRQHALGQLALWKAEKAAKP